jgi:phage protein U
VSIRQVRCKSRTVALAAVLLVCACFESDHTLLKSSDIVTPLPPNFFFVALDKDGKFLPDGDGKLPLDPSDRPIAPSLTLVGSVYTPNVTGMSHRIANIDADRQKQQIFLLETKLDPNKEQVVYSLVKINGDRLIIFSQGGNYKIDFQLNKERAAERAELVSAMNLAGVKFTDSGSDFHFDDREQLLAAARVYAQTLNFNQGDIMYRIVDKDKPEAVAQLTHDLVQAKQDAAQVEALAELKRYFQQHKEAEAQVAAPTDPLTTPEPKSDPRTYPEIQFQGYSHPKLFGAIYRGGTDPTGMIDLYLIFLQEFLKDVVESSNCNHLVSASTYAWITTKAVPAVVRNQMKDYNEANRQRATSRPGTGPIDYGKLFMEGANQALGPLLSGMKEIDNARNDFILFERQYGCDTSVAKRFFENMEMLVAKL